MLKSKISAAALANYLLDQGLLFEINRTILHPRGLALAASITEEGDTSLIVMSGRDTSGEGIVFTEEAFQNGAGKFEKFKEANAIDYQQRSDTYGKFVDGSFRQTKGL